MGDDEIETKSRDMFNDMMTIEGHFENVGYRGDTVILGIKELAEFIRFYQPAALAPVDVDAIHQDGFDEGFESGKLEATEFDRDLRRAVFGFLEKRGQIENSEEYTAQDIMDCLVAYEHYLINTNKAPKPVDVEGMKIEGTDVGSCFDVSVLTTSDIYENGWNDCIDHLAARGCLGVPEGYVLLPINPTREAVCQRIAISFDEDCAWRGNVVKTMGRNLSESRITVIFTPSQLREIYGLMVKAMLKAAPKKED